MGDAHLIIWLMLAGLAYVLVTCVLGTLAARVKHERERHDLVVEARRRRQVYLEKLNSDPGEGEEVELLV